MELDPRNLYTLQQIALSYQELGRYAEAIAALDRTAIVPDNVETQAGRGLFYLDWKADTRPLHRTRLMQSSPKDRAPWTAPRTSYFTVADAIRLRPNKHSSRWATIHAGATPRLR